MEGRRPRWRRAADTRPSSSRDKRKRLRLFCCAAGNPRGIAGRRGERDGEKILQEGFVWCGRHSPTAFSAHPIRQRLCWELWGSAVRPRRCCPTLGHPSVAWTPCHHCHPQAPLHSVLTPPFPPLLNLSPSQQPSCVSPLCSALSVPRLSPSLPFLSCLSAFPFLSPSLIPHLFSLSLLYRRALQSGDEHPEACAPIHTDEKCSPRDATSTWARKTPAPSQCRGVGWGRACNSVPNGILSTTLRENPFLPYFSQTEP